MYGPKIPRISVTAMFEYSNSGFATSAWMDSAQERNNSRQVPSLGKSDIANADFGSWPSLYGNQPPAGSDKDAFLGQYIHRIYCRECREQQNMAARGSQASTSGTGSPNSQPDSPPQYQLDQMSLAENMTANKQVLNRKLMVRRTVPELVHAGIYPTSPHAFAGQRVHLERAKTSDFLKHKIERRPAKDFLVQQHILDDSNVDPSLQSMQRKLKKAKLTDELNEKLAHRPGPLELVEQRILEADPPIKAAIKEGKLEFPKTEEVAEQSSIAKVPYVIESPKSGSSSPEPTDCDNDSNGSFTSTGFSTTRVPSPPDITPLLTKPRAKTVTIGGNTVTVPVTASSLVNSGQLIAVPQPQPYPSQVQRMQQSSSHSSRSNRRASKQSRPKQQNKQRVIKFHEYKGPPAAKTSSTNSSGNSSSVGTFVTTTGPMQQLEGLTPYEVRVHQQKLYLQCQIEVEKKGPSQSTVFVPVKTTPNTPMPHQKPEMSEAEPVKSRPVTPSLSLKSPNSHHPLHTSRSLSHLEDMKVADLKQELRQRNLTVSGSKPQLIERLRAHQLEMSASVPSVGSTSSDLAYSSNVPSVQSFSDEGLMAPPSVTSVTSNSMANHLTSPPPTPCSPNDDFLMSPPSVASMSQGMDTEEANSQSAKTTEDIVREQARQIELLQRQLMQFQQQFPQPPPQSSPFVVPPSPGVQQTVSEPATPAFVPQQVQTLTMQQVQELMQQSGQQVDADAVRQQLLSVHQPLQQHVHTPVDITDKQVYLATADGKMTPYKVILHTGNGLVQPTSSTADITSSHAPTSLMANEPLIATPTAIVPERARNTQASYSQGADKQLSVKTESVNSAGQTVDVDDVLDVLIEAGEIDPQTMNRRRQHTADSFTPDPSPSHADAFPSSNQQAHTSDTTLPQSTNDVNSHLGVQEPLSPLVGMDWMDTNTNSQYLDSFESQEKPSLDTGLGGMLYNGNNELEWLTDALQGGSVPQKHLHSYDDINSNGSTLSVSDPVLSPKPPDLMNIFDLDESDFRVAAESGSDLNWDKLIGQTSNHL